MGKAAVVISHWHHSVEGLSTSALECYAAIERGLADKQLELEIERIVWREGGVLSANREYLRVAYGRFVFDICAAPFGKDFFFSWWLGRKTPNLAALGCLVFGGLPVAFLISIMAAGVVKGTLLFLALLGLALFGVTTGRLGEGGDVQDALAAIPFVGPIYARLFTPTTYYSEDSRIMFEETVHRVVLDVVRSILSVKSMPQLTPDQSALPNRGGLSASVSL